MINLSDAEGSAARAKRRLGALGPSDQTVVHGAHISHSGAELIPAREGLTGRAGLGLPWYGEEGYSPLPMPGRGHRASMGPWLLA